LTCEPGIGECRRQISVASVKVTGDDGTNGPGSARKLALERRVRWLNVQAGNPKVALVTDDVVSTHPWTPSYLRIYGTAELVERRGQFGPVPYMRITPTMSWSWNLEGLPFSHDREVVVHRTVHEAPVGQN
jgi:pyridoxamine 5'-phosphate oxidase family protein